MDNDSNSLSIPYSEQYNTLRPSASQHLLEDDSDNTSKPAYLNISYTFTGKNECVRKKESRD